MINMDEIKKKIIFGVDGQKPLSPDQKRAVESDKKRIGIVAGAGAGKTETLTRRILYLLLCEGINPEEIVAFTFTEKAAQSMKSRIYSTATQLMGEDYAAKLGKMYVGTIHSYALRILQDHFGYGNYELLDEKQEMAFVTRRGWEIGVNELAGSPYVEKCKKFVEAVNVIYDELIPREKLCKENPEFYEVFKNYEEKLNQYHRLTFSGLIYLAVENLQENSDKLPKIKHLIVDEYQDINRAQETLIGLIGKGAHVMVVGDPRQTIYQWRGSDDKCFERFVTQPDTETIVIPENRRSGWKIVEIGNKVAENFEEKFDPMKPFRKEEGYTYVVVAETPTEEARWVAEQIEKLKEKGLNYSDFGILLRSVNTSGEPFIREFKKRGIPYIVGGTSGLFKREEAIAIGKLFTWLCDEGFWREGYGNEKISHDELVDSAIENWYSATGLISPYELDDIREKLEEWRKNVLDGKYQSFQEVYHDLLNILKFEELDPEDKLSSAVMANLGRFSNLLGDYENAIRLGGNKLSWSRSTFKGLMWYINLYAIVSYEEQMSEDVRGVDAVQITTIHQAKGLEWPIVFIPAMVSKRFPSSHVGKKKNWLINRDLFSADRYDLKEEDERRLLYVAVTRAKSTLVMSAFKKINKSVELSKFLEEILERNPTAIKALSPVGDKIIEFDKSFLSGTEEEICTFDAGEIVDYTKCPYFFRMRHIWNYDAPLNEEIGYGNALHYCLRRVVELNKEGCNPVSAVIEAIKDDFYLPYAPDEKAKMMKKGAEKILLDYVTKHIDEIEEVSEVEYRLEFPESNSVITGKVDVIIEKNGDVEVREYKTSKKVTNPEQAAFQVKLYAVGLKAQGLEIKRGSVVYLDDGEIHEVEVDEKSLDEAKKQARQILRNFRDQLYNGKPGEFCENCDYRKICRWAKRGD